jgi:hypothetical protein
MAVSKGTFLGAAGWPDALKGDRDERANRAG